MAAPDLIARFVGGPLDGERRQLRAAPERYPAERGWYEREPGMDDVRLGRAMRGEEPLRYTWHPDLKPS